MSTREQRAVASWLADQCHIEAVRQQDDLPDSQDGWVEAASRHHYAQLRATEEST